MEENKLVIYSKYLVYFGKNVINAENEIFNEKYFRQMRELKIE